MTTNLTDEGEGRDRTHLGADLALADDDGVGEADVGLEALHHLRDERVVLLALLEQRHLEAHTPIAGWEGNGRT